MPNGLVIDVWTVCYQLLEMVERNELNRPVLALLDENMASALENNQVSAFLCQVSFPGA